MAQYHDFEYVKYILNLPYLEGLELYNKCIGRFNDRRLWELFLVEITRGFEGSFDDYKKMVECKNIENNMTNEEKDQEEKRIIEKFIGRAKNERLN